MAKGKVSTLLYIIACYTSVSTKPEVYIAGLSLGVSCEKAASSQVGRGKCNAVLSLLL